MKNLLFFIALLPTIVLTQTTGQVANYGSSGNAGYSSTGQLNALLGPIQDAKAKLNFKNEGFQGSPYTFEVFMPTTLYYGDEEMGNLFYRYNAYNEEIEIKKENIESEGVRALGRDKKIVVLNNGKPMSFKTFIDRTKRTQNGYLTKIYDGKKYSLYKRTDVKFTEGQKAQNSFVKAIPARFSKFTEYYLEIDGMQRIDELELNNRKLVKLVPESGKEALKTYLKENKIKIKDEASIAKVLDFLDKA
ncbi:hypothetical protein [uncultured Croceitalea sp.]|uniref:hypothetical protein n=1 Tax=uncultured Croceitalea sp. TaxID=1798908 RepID=UPI0033066FFF